mgnify:CR=1 FL=1
MRTRRLALPLLGAAAFPTLMLISPTTETLSLLWSAAMVMVAMLAGEALAPVVSGKVAGIWLLLTLIGLTVAVLTGLLSFHAIRLEVDLGLQALHIITVVMPAYVFARRRLQER